MCIVEDRNDAWSLGFDTLTDVLNSNIDCINKQLPHGLDRARPG